MTPCVFFISHNFQGNSPPPPFFVKFTPIYPTLLLGAKKFKKPSKWPACTNVGCGFTGFSFIIAASFVPSAAALMLAMALSGLEPNFVSSA